MTLTIELTPDEEAQLTAAAQREKLAPQDLIHKLIADYLPQATQPTPDAENQAVIDLLRSWRQEDATEDVQELERRDAETHDLMANLASSRLTLPIPKL